DTGYVRGDLHREDETCLHTPIIDDDKEACITLVAIEGGLKFSNPAMRLLKPVIGIYRLVKQYLFSFGLTGKQYEKPSCIVVIGRYLVVCASCWLYHFQWRTCWKQSNSRTRKKRRSEPLSRTLV